MLPDVRSDNIILIFDNRVQGLEKLRCSFAAEDVYKRQVFAAVLSELSLQLSLSTVLLLLVQFPLLDTSFSRCSDCRPFSAAFTSAILLLLYAQPLFLLMTLNFYINTASAKSAALLPAYKLPVR